jgi:hypothetical protein
MEIDPEGDQDPTWTEEPVEEKEELESLCSKENFAKMYTVCFHSNRTDHSSEHL